MTWRRRKIAVSMAQQRRQLMTGWTVSSNSVDVVGLTIQPDAPAATSSTGMTTLICSLPMWWPLFVLPG